MDRPSTEPSGGNSVDFNNSHCIGWWMLSMVPSGMVDLLLVVDLVDKMERVTTS